MKKSNKFFKFLSLFSVFALVLTVGLCPMVAKASSEKSSIEPDDGMGNGYRLSVVVETLEYGHWSTKLAKDVYLGMEEHPWVFEIDSSYIDHVDENFRIRLIYDYHTFLKQNSYTFNNYFEFGFGSVEYYMSYAKMNVYYSLDEYTWSPLYGNIAHGFNYPEFRATVTPRENCPEICFEFVSNFHEQFQASGEREQCYFMIGSGSIPIYYDVFIPSYPDFNLPDADVEGLQDFTGFAPDDDLQAFIDGVFRYRFVSISMLMLVTLGVLAFLLFGERK